MTEEEAGYSDAAIKASARIARQLYIAYTREGFTPKEALELVKVLLTQGLQK